MKDIDFLDSYWQEAKRIANDVKENLHIINKVSKPYFQDGGVKMHIAKFSDIKESWSVSDIIGEQSSTLEKLGDKIYQMILKGRADHVKRMLNSIVYGKPKKITKREEFLGYGHFHWDYSAHTLNESEIKRVKEFFQL